MRRRVSPACSTPLTPHLAHSLSDSIAQPADSPTYSYVLQRSPPTGFIGWSYYLLMLPLRLTYHTVFDLYRLVVRLCRGDTRVRVSDPLGDVTAFIAEFREQYGTRHPAFYQGSYSQAVNDAKKELRFLVVYLHSDGNPDSAQFCRETLCDPGVIDLINGRSIFWACSTSRPEGYRVSEALRAPHASPFVGVVALREHRRMALVGRLQGALAAPALCAQLLLVMQHNERHLHTERAQREERSETQALRLQQDEAYLLSLRADQEKERVRRERRATEQRADDERRSQQRQETQRQQDIAEERVLRSLRVPAEPGAHDADSVTTVIKLPSGTRLARRFLRSHTTQAIYDFVFSHPEAPEVFQIVCNFPRRVLTAPATPTTTTTTDIATTTAEPQRLPTLGECGLRGSEVLFVQDLSDE